MTAWQFRFYLVPEKKVNEIFKDIPKIIKEFSSESEPVYSPNNEIINYLLDDINIYNFINFFEKYFKKKYKDYEGIWYESNYSGYTKILVSEYIMVEIDANIFDYFLLSKIIKLCKSNNYLFVSSPYGEVVELNFFKICELFLSSPSLEFVHKMALSD